MRKLILTGIFILLLQMAVSAQVWNSDNFQVAVKDNHVFVSAEGVPLVDISAIMFNFTKPLSMKVIEAGTDKMVIEAVYPEVVYHNTANKKGVARIEITKVKNGLRFFSEPEWANQVTLQIRDQDEHYYGLIEKLMPNNIRSTDLRGAVIPIDVESFGNRYYENYASAYSTFYMSSRGYGAFFDTFYRGQYQMGVNGMTQLHHDHGTLDWYIFYGPDGKKIHEGYFSVIGKPKYVPLWACGPIVWRDENKGGSEEILQDIQKFTDMKIPIAGWMVDRPYSNGAHEWSKMDFNDKFANPGEWIKTINEKYGLQFLTWIGPLTFGDKDFPGLLSNYKGYIDLSDPDAVREFGRRLKEHQYSVNVRGHKMDRADENFPVTDHWKDGTNEFSSRNKYVYLFAKVVDQFLRDSFGKDQFNFARAGFHRCQPYLSALWGGDSRSTWDGLRCQVINALRCGFMGFPMWGSDVGGYLSSANDGYIPENLYARWLQFGAWSGLYEIKIDNSGGNGKDRPPWKYGETLQRIFRNSCETRMQLLPYIYSALNTSYKNGVLMKPLAYVFPDDEKAFGIYDEYMFGDAFLVAPVLDSTNQRHVYLPAGTWYDFNDLTKSVVGPSSRFVHVPLDQIPVYVRANSIFVTGNVLQGNAKLWQKKVKKALVIHAFPGDTHESASFDFVDPFDGEQEKEIRLNASEGKITVNIPALSIGGTVQVKLDRKPSQVAVNEQEVSFKWDKKQGVVEITFSAKEELTIKIE